MATTRRSPDSFVDVPGNGLDQFETEIVSADPEPAVRAVGAISARARRIRILPALAAACSATAMTAIGIGIVLPVALTAPTVTTAPIITTASSVPPMASSALDGVKPAAVTRSPAASVSTQSNAPEGARALSPARVRAFWSKTDTRSLDRALNALRSATLAFQRCEMRVTSDDRAVAHCDEAGPGHPATRVAWTIDFRRNDGHWLIDGLSATRPARLNR